MFSPGDRLRGGNARRTHTVNGPWPVRVRRGPENMTKLPDSKPSAVYRSLKFNLDWSWGDSTQRRAWWDQWRYLKRLHPPSAIQMSFIRWRAYKKWQEYQRFWARQRFLRREARKKVIYND